MTIVKVSCPKCGEMIDLRTQVSPPADAPEPPWVVATRAYNSDWMLNHEPPPVLQDIIERACREHAAALAQERDVLKRDLELERIALNHRLRETAKERDHYETERNELRATVDRLTAERDALVRELVNDSIDVLTNVAQVLDGWHNDGTAWSEWDEQVRTSVTELLKRFYKLKRLNT